MENNRPERNFRFGGVRVSVWRDLRKGTDGGSYERRSVTLDRAYKDTDGRWKNTQTLKESDIPKAIAALQHAFEYMTEKGGDEAE